VRYGAGLDGVDADGNTLLHIAASSYLRASTNWFLLDHDANADAVNADAVNTAGDTLQVYGAHEHSVWFRGVQLRIVY
jgi:hypothetical protein